MYAFINPSFCNTVNIPLFKFLNRFVKDMLFRNYTNFQENELQITLSGALSPLSLFLVNFVGLVMLGYTDIVANNHLLIYSLYLPHLSLLFFVSTWTRAKILCSRQANTPANTLFLRQSVSPSHPSIHPRFYIPYPNPRRVHFRHSSAAKE